jgi:prephenate dehydrogenase
VTPSAGPVTALRAAVVGTGLIGGSILRRLHDAGMAVQGWDPDPQTRRTGAEQGLAFAEQIADAVRDSDIVFLAGPLIHLPRTLAEVAATAPPEAILTDVGSTKVAVWQAAREQGLVHRFIPGHPMAGAERAGLGAADPELFTGASWVLCPPDQGPLDRFRTLVELIVTGFGAHVVPMSPTVHDSVAALASHIPHLLAGSLAGSVARSPLRDAVLGLAAGSFRDGTRVAGTPNQRTADMLISNRGSILRQLEQVREYLDGLTEALRADDVATLSTRYAEGRQLRQALLDRPMTPGRHCFPADGPIGNELAFLLDLGESGGWLTSCTLQDGQVCYDTRRPG